MKPTIKTLIELLFDYSDDYIKALQLVLILNEKKTLPEIWNEVLNIQIPHKKYSRMYDRDVNELLLKIMYNHTIVGGLK